MAADADPSQTADADPSQTNPDAPPAPEGLGASGRALWDSIAGEYDLAQHERGLLREAARVADRLDDLDAVVRAEGVTIASPQGVKAHPALVEARQQGVVLSRLVASLRIPDADGNTPQRRGAARGSYTARRPYGKHSVNR